MTAKRLTRLEHERRFPYEDEFNPVIRRYQATVELMPTSDAGTSIRWTGEYSTRWGLGANAARVQRLMQHMVNGLAQSDAR